MDRKQEDELFDVLRFIKDRMATKDELSAVKAGVDRLENKVDNFMDSEVDKRKQLEVRVSKIETKVFAK